MDGLRRHVTALLVLALVAVSAALAMGGARTALADDGPLKITVKVTDGGFDPPTVEVPQGASVELTFVWANQAHPTDEHIIVIPGYKLESEKIDSTNKQTTVKFIATQTGTFAYKCDVECDAHDSLQHGEIKVTAGAGGAATGGGAAGSQLQASKLVFDPTSGVVVNGNTVALSATLQDKDGKPIAKQEVQFFAEQQFLGRTGQVEIAQAKTNANGVAYAIYHPTTPNAEKLTAKFAGGGVFDGTEQTVELAASPKFAGKAIPSEDDNLHGIKTVAPYALVLLIGSVWATFAFILYQAWSVSRVAQGGDPPKLSH